MPKKGKKLGPTPSSHGGGVGGGHLAQQHRLQVQADRLSKETHFTMDEAKVLLYMHSKILHHGVLDRLRFREILRNCFQMTEDVMLDLVFRAFDRDSDTQISDIEWVKGLSVMIRGDIDELTLHVYTVYDMNGDGSLAREELFHCLKGCIIAGYGVEADDVEEFERDIIEIAMKKLDWDRDGQITLKDFQMAVMEDPLLLQAIGPCLPGPRSIAAFLALITASFRRYTASYGSSWVRVQSRSGPGERRKSRAANFRHSVAQTGFLSAASIVSAKAKT